jgi:mono/diheme cytochrome c family protein/rhodanese-related sulfurtransferase
LRSFVAAFLIAACAACGPRTEPIGAPPPPDAAAATPPPEIVERGEALYLRYCALCHGRQGEGYAADRANALTSPDFLAIATPEFLHRSIADGRPGTPMSAWGREHGGPLDDEQIGAIVAWLRSRAREPLRDVSGVRLVGSVERGRALWQAHCVRCHGERGEGGELAPSLSHPNFHRLASDGYLRYAIEHGRRGTPMPPFAHLPSQSIDDLVAFVRTLEHEPTQPVAPSGDPPPGMDDLILHPDGPAPEFALREGRFVSADAVRTALEQGRRMVILDARAPSDWALGHIPGAAPFPFYDIEQLSEHLPRDGTWILAYCSCPHAASGRVVDELRRRGFRNTAVIDEGWPYWLSRGYPVARGVVP